MISFNKYIYLTLACLRCDILMVVKIKITLSSGMTHVVWKMVTTFQMNLFPLISGHSGGSRFLQDVGAHPPNWMVSHPRNS